MYCYKRGKLEIWLSPMTQNPLQQQTCQRQSPKLCSKLKLKSSRLLYKEVWSWTPSRSTRIMLARSRSVALRLEFNRIHLTPAILKFWKIHHNWGPVLSGLEQRPLRKSSSLLYKEVWSWTPSRSTRIMLARSRSVALRLEFNRIHLTAAILKFWRIRHEIELRSCSFRFRAETTS